MTAMMTASGLLALFGAGVITGCGATIYALITLKKISKRKKAQ